MAQVRTRVAYILTPITFGGAERVSLNFLRALDRSRFDVRPILLTRPWEAEPYLAQQIRQLGYAFDTLPVALKSSGDPLRVLRVAWLLYGLLKQREYDLVHTHGYFADICGLPVARLLGCPSLSTCHGFITTDHKLQAYNRLDAWVQRLLCGRVIAVSEGIREELISQGIGDSRIVVIPNAVAMPDDVSMQGLRRQEKRAALGLGDGELVVGYLGRLSAEKGLSHLVAAVDKLRTAKVMPKLVLVGDGPERPTLEREVQIRGLGNQVIFAGFQTDAESWLPAFDVFALPSLTEGTPMALLEAMVAGVALVATAVGGVPAVVTDGVDGLLVKPGDVSALADGLLRLCSDAGLRHRLGRAGVAAVRANYGIENWCREIQDQYSGVRVCAPRFPEKQSF